MSPIDDALREDLSALLDGVLEPEREAELRRRMEEDEELRLEFAALRRTVEVVRALPREKAPPELRARLAARATRPTPVLRLLVPLAAAAAVLVAAILVLREEPDKEPVRIAKTDKTDEVAPSYAGDAEKPVEEAARQRAGRKEAEQAEGALDVTAPAPRAQPPVDEAAREAERSNAGRGAAAVRREAPGEAKDLLRSVEAGARLRDGRMREAYLSRLEELKTPELRVHIEGFARVDARKAVDRDGPPPLDASANSLAEARRIAALLQLSYPVRPLPSTPAGAKAKSAPAPDAAAAGPAVLEARREELTVEIEATREQAEAIRTWLARLSGAVGERLGRDAAGKRELRTLRKEAGTAPGRMRVRIRFPPPKPEPAPVPAAEAEADER